MIAALSLLFVLCAGAFGAGMLILFACVFAQLTQFTEFLYYQF